MEEGMDKEKMKEIRKVIGLDEGIRSEMDMDGDGKISFEEYQEYMEKAVSKKKKMKATAVYLGDKVVDLIVVSVAVVTMYFFGISII